MTIFEQLAALEAEVAALKATPAAVDNSAEFAALDHRVATLETEVGTPPAPPVAPAV